MLPAEARMEILSQAGGTKRRSRRPASSDVTLVHAAGNMMKLLVPQPVAPGSEVRVTLSEGVVTGYVALLHPDGPPYSAYVGIRKVTPAVSDIASLIAAVGVRSGKHAGSAGHNPRDKFADLHVKL